MSDEAKALTYDILTIIVKIIGWAIDLITIIGG